VALLDALAAAGLPVTIQDAVAAAVGDAPEVSLSSLRGQLTGVGVGAAAALHIVRQLVSVFGWLLMPTLLVGLGCECAVMCVPLALLSCFCDACVTSQAAASPAVEEARRRAEEDAAAAAAALARARELEAQLAEREARMGAEVEASRKAAAEVEVARAALAAESARKAAAEAEATRKAEAVRKAVSCAKGLKGGWSLHVASSCMLHIALAEEEFDSAWRALLGWRCVHVRRPVAMLKDSGHSREGWGEVRED
jgi:hypothetical protein